MSKPKNWNGDQERIKRGTEVVGEGTKGHVT